MEHLMHDYLFIIMHDLINKTKCHIKNDKNKTKKKQMNKQTKTQCYRMFPSEGTRAFYQKAFSLFQALKQFFAPLSRRLPRSTT